MPRQARIDAPGALHHIIVRGIERKRIFRSNKDRNDFLERVGDLLKDTATSCYAWALIPNHVHLLLRTGSAPIATFMRRLLTGYAVSFNKRYHRHGHLFQNRYKSILCQEDTYLLELVRYMHLNPLRAGLVRDYEALCRYSYCGHSVLLEKKKNDWQDTDYILGLFSSRKKQALRSYRSFVEEGVAKGSRPDLTGGGLIRSQGGWQEIGRLKKEGVRIKSDERILGDSSFVMETLKEAKEKFQRGYLLRSRGYDVEKIAIQVGKLFGIEAKDLLKPGKSKAVVPARSVLCYWAVTELGESATSLAKRIGITQPAVSISVQRGEKIVREKNLFWESIL